MAMQDENLTPILEINEPVPADLPVPPRLLILALDALTITDPPPTPAPRTATVFRGIHSDYMTMDFLKRCFTCKKEIGEMVDIYMYNDLSFCSDDCRNKEMDNDTKEEVTKREKMKNDKRNLKKNTKPNGNEKVSFFIGDA